MDNHQWRLSQAYTYAFYISIHISITLIPYHLIFLLHVNLFPVTCSMSLAYPLFILFLYSYFEYFTYSYICHVFFFHACHMSFSMFLFFFRLHIMSLIYVFSSIGSMIYCILCTITYIISYPAPILYLLPCSGYTPMLDYSVLTYCYIIYFLIRSCLVIYFVFVCSYSISHILCAFVYFMYFSCVYILIFISSYIVLLVLVTIYTFIA